MQSTNGTGCCKRRGGALRDAWLCAGSILRGTHKTLGEKIGDVVLAVELFGSSMCFGCVSDRSPAQLANVRIGVQAVPYLFGPS